MAHSIFGDRFLGAREPAWHGLGKVFDPALKLTPSAGVLMSGSDYNVQKYPLVVHLPNGKTVASDKVALVREPTHDDGSYHILGYASDQYQVVQNLEIGFMVDHLAERWPLETVGALGKGETIFICLDAGMAKVANEEIKQFFMVSNSHTGGRSLRVALTPVRVVCQNTLIAATNQATVIANLPHTLNVHEDAKFHVDLIASVQKQQALLFESFEAMTKVTLVEEQVNEILAAAYPDPRPPRRKQVADIVAKDPATMALLADNKQLASSAMSQLRTAQADYEYALKRTKQFRDGALQCLDVANQQNPVLANTPWMVWQGITETENFRNGDKKNPQSTLENILFGDRAQAMARGYSKALELSQ